MRPEFLSGRRGAGIVALAVVAGILASQIVLVLTAGSIGIPGIFAVRLDGAEAPDETADADAPAVERTTRKAPPPIAMPAPPEDAPVSPTEPQAGDADGPSAPPLAQPAEDGEDTSPTAPVPPASPDDGQAAEAEPEIPATGPVGWQGPEGAPGGDAKADEEAVLKGPIDLNVGDALSDLNREEAEEEEEAKKNGDAAARNGPASAAQPAPPPPPEGSRQEVLPWEAVKPDPELMAPVEVPEDTPEFSLPAPDVVKGWLQGRSSNAASGDTRYELWLEPSMDMRLRLTAVGYQFKPAGGDMITRLSRKPESGFRVSYEAPSCEGNITLTLTYKDGRSHKVPLDGCGSFN